MKAARSFETYRTVYPAACQHTAVRNSRAIKYVSATVGSCVYAESYGFHSEHFRSSYSITKGSLEAQIEYI
jgi:hypothetical protein